MSVKQRVEQQPGFVLHTHPWRETSLIVEVFARDHGRVAMVAKGARRPQSALRGVIMAFQPLLIDWSGGGEVKTLHRAEWMGGQPLLGGRALMCGYYLNELLVRLTAREDPHPHLYADYARTIAALGHCEPVAPLLRSFELSLLRELGYGVALEHDGDDGAPIESGTDYVYIIERGAVKVRAEAADFPALSGQTLLDMGRGDFSRPETLAQSKSLLRMLINHYLGGQTLQSRRVLTELQEL